MITYALVSARSTLAVEMYASREAAEADLAEAVASEPDFADILSIVEIDLSGRVCEAVASTAWGAGEHGL